MSKSRLAPSSSTCHHHSHHHTHHSHHHHHSHLSLASCHRILEESTNPVFLLAHSARVRAGSDFAASQRRACIALEFLAQRPACAGSYNFEGLDAEDLVLLFQLYDREFFEGAISSVFTTHKRNLSFHVVSSLPTQAGHFSRSGYDHDLTICWPIIAGPFESWAKDDGTVSVQVCGCTCSNRLQALMRVFEHELCHLLCFTNFFHVEDSHGEEFRAIAYAFFRHTRATHELPVATVTATSVSSTSSCGVAAHSDLPPPSSSHHEMGFFAQHQQLLLQNKGPTVARFDSWHYKFDASVCSQVAQNAGCFTPTSADTPMGLGHHHHHNTAHGMPDFYMPARGLIAPSQLPLVAALAVNVDGEEEEEDATMDYDMEVVEEEEEEEEAEEFDPDAFFADYVCVNRRESRRPSRRHFAASTPLASSNGNPFARVSTQEDISIVAASPMGDDDLDMQAVGEFCPPTSA